MADKRKPLKKTRILILSDTHAATTIPAPGDSRPSSANVQRPLPSADVLIHCGDLTMNGSVDQHTIAVNLIDSVNAGLKIVIPGNHDLTLDREYYDTHPYEHTNWDKYSDRTLDGIRDSYVGQDAQAKGIMYLEEGTGTYLLANGARLNVYASAWTPQFWNWAFGYPRDVDRFNPVTDVAEPRNAVPDFDEKNGIDIMVTHGAPQGMLDRTCQGDHVGCAHLRRAVERCRPQLHCFGHIHEAYGAMRKTWDLGVDHELPVHAHVHGAEAGSSDVSVDATDIKFGSETVFVNASIMNLSYRPVNMPWVVDIMLPET